MTQTTARDLLNVESDFCDLDMRLKELTRFVLMTGVEGDREAADRLKKARKFLARTLWQLSAGITEAVQVIENNPAEVPPW